MAWLARAGVTARLDVAWNQRGPRPASLDERDRLYALRRLLEDESADPRDRLAGCLLLLYGQPFTRTAALRRTDITGVCGQAGIRLGRGTLPLPPPMDTIARLVLESQPSNGDGWLFAGRHPGTHLTAEHLRVRVARYGLASITSRSSAILALLRNSPRPCSPSDSGFTKAALRRGRAPPARTTEAMSPYGLSSRRCSQQQSQPSAQRELDDGSLKPTGAQQSVITFTVPQSDALPHCDRRDYKRRDRIHEA